MTAKELVEELESTLRSKAAISKLTAETIQEEFAKIKGKLGVPKELIDALDYSGEDYDIVDEDYGSYTIGVNAVNSLLLQKIADACGVSIGSIDFEEDKDKKIRISVDIESED